MEETPEKQFETIQKVEKNSRNVIANLLKFFGKIKSVGQFDDYLKDIIFIPFVEWFVKIFIIRAFIIFFCLTAIGFLFYSPPPTRIQIALAEGISILWYILESFTNDIANAIRRKI